MFFKLWPWVNLDRFYIKVKFSQLGFCVDKNEKYVCFWKNIAAVGSRVG